VDGHLPRLLAFAIPSARLRCALLAQGTLKAAVKTVEINRKLKETRHKGGADSFPIGPSARCV